MTPDWDVLQSITTTFRLFPSLPSLRHVKGHQDRNLPFTTLPLPAQLNVFADHLAGQYDYPPNISSTVSPLISGATALLHGPDGTISSNYRQVIRRMATAPVLQQYLCSKHTWTRSTFDLVCWDAHGIAIRAHFARRHFLVKFIHDWLPLGYLTSNYASFYCSTCPSCRAPEVVEDRSHFLRCPSTSNLRSSLFSDLTSFWAPNKVSPLLSYVLRQGLHSWLSNLPLRFLSPLPASVHLLIARQTLVGWDHIFYGRMVTDWCSLQDNFLAAENLSSRYCSGRSFLTGTIRIIWEHIFKLWIARNNALHGSDPSTREAALVAAAQREILEL